MDFSEFKASLVYSASSKRATQRNPVLKKKIKNKITWNKRPVNESNYIGDLDKLCNLLSAMKTERDSY